MATLRSSSTCQTRSPRLALTLTLTLALTLTPTLTLTPGDYLVATGPASEVFQQNGYHAVLYHGPSDSYRFHSTEHRRAAERKFPEAAARGAAVVCAEVFVYSC